MKKLNDSSRRKFIRTFATSAAAMAVGADRKRILPPQEYTYEAENGYKGGPYDHFVNFFDSIRTGAKVTEDAIFGYRASAPALLCNDSYNQDKAILWNPEKMQLIPS